ncbi:uncharacterized protein [Montipora foliosa]|uniref:uncharacterized protein n=1 Tax=Montipora foliosa TaxID=591990 RepID=UPI0035F1688E
MKVKELKKQRNDTINLKEKVFSELMKPQTNVKENEKDMEDMEQLLKILELLDEKQSENERELDVHKRMFEMMIGGHGKNPLSEEDEVKAKMRDKAQRKRDDIRDEIVSDHQEKEQMKGEIVKLKAMNAKMMQLLGVDQSEENDSDKSLSDLKDLSFDKKRKAEEDTLDSLLEGFKKRGKKLKK